MKNRNYRRLVVPTEKESPALAKYSLMKPLSLQPRQDTASEVLTSCRAQGLPFQAQNLFCGKPNSPFAKFAMGVRL